MNRTLRYRLQAAPGEILEIAKSRTEDYPSTGILGNTEEGVFLARGFQVDYSMKPDNGGTELVLEFTKKPPLPWTLVRSFLDREAKKWQGENDEKKSNRRRSSRSN